MADPAEVKAKLRSAFRDFRVDGVPASGANEPVKPEVRAGIDALIDLASQATVTKAVATKAQLSTIPSPAFGDSARVTSDPLGDVTNGNGVWSWSGSAWTWIGPWVDPAVQAQIDQADRAVAVTYSQPNVFTLSELDFTDRTRMLDLTGFGSFDVDGEPFARVTAEPGVTRTPYWRVPSSELGDPSVFTAALDVTSVSAAGGTGKAQLLIQQFDAGLVEIAGTRVTIDICGPEGLVTPKRVVAPSVVRNAACVTIVFAVRMNAAGASASRSVTFREMLLAAGTESHFRQPANPEATPDEILAAVRRNRFISPLGLAAAAPTIIDNRLAELGLDPANVEAVMKAIAFDLPADLGWDEDVYPAHVIRNRGKPWTTFDLDAMAQAQVDPAAWAAPPIYVDYVAGLDTRDGTSWALAVKTLSKARTLGAASGGPFRLMLRKNQTWLRTGGFQPDAYPAVYDHVVQVEDGGTATISNHDSLAWAVDGAYPNCYSANRSSIARVFDPSTPDADGVFAEYPKYPDAAALNTAGAVDGWAQVGSILYVRRASGGAVTNANTRAYLSVVNYEATAEDISVYMEGLRFHGGSTGAVHFESTAAANIVTKGCRFEYAGHVTERDAYRIRNMAGICISIDDVAAAVHKDGFNLHVDVGANVLYGLFVNPKTRRIGSALENSKNAFTLHETSRAIVINPDFPATINGSTVANVGPSRCIVFGGTVAAGPSNGVGKGAVETTDTAIIWLVGVTITGDLIARDSSIIYTRDCKHTGSIVTSGAGQVLAF